MFLKVVCLFPGGSKGCVGHTWKALTVFQKVLVSLTHVHTRHLHSLPADLLLLLLKDRKKKSKTEPSSLGSSGCVQLQK